LVEGARFVQISDLGAIDDPMSRAAFELTGTRTALFIPLRKDGMLVGRISASRREVKPFTEKEIGLLESFAAQAVIAIENARLLNELRQRSDDLSESLEQQTATSEVLKVISSSPGELKPVFDAMLASAVRICEAKFGTLLLCEGDDFRVVAQHNTPPALAELRQREPILRLGPHTSPYRSKKAKQPIQITDLTAEPVYFEREPNRVALVELGGYRAVLSVPMVKENEVIGVINMYRQDAGTFSDNQVELVKNFAAQAVIAIENARLLNELRQRTDDLSEALEFQTATGEVLRIVTSSPENLQSVFDAMLEKAIALCEAKFGILHLHDGKGFTVAADRHLPPAYAKMMRGRPFSAEENTGIARLVASKAPLHMRDMFSDGAYARGEPLRVAAVDLGGVRSLLAVPLLKKGEVLGMVRNL
jgi:GAF domain-containing protein